MVYLASGGMWLGVAQIFASAVAFTITVILANILTQETLGEYRFLMAALMILGIFALPGMRPAIIESTPKGFRKNLSTGYRATQRWATIGSAIALAGSLYYFLQSNSTLGIAFLVIAVALPWFDASILYFEFLKALQKFALVARYTIIGRGVLLVSILTSALLFPHLSWVLFSIFLVASILPNTIFHQQTQKTLSSEDDTSDPGLISYAKHLSIMAALSLVAFQIDKIFVWHFLGAEQLALFFIAFAIPQEIIRFLTIIPTLAFPKFASSDDATIRANLLPKLYIFLGCIALGAAAYIFLAPILFSYIFPQYMVAVPYSQVLIIATLASAFLPISTYFTAHKHTRTLYQLAIILPVTRIVASFIFILYFGLWGAVAAIILEAVISALCHLWFFLRSPKVRVT